MTGVQLKRFLESHNVSKKDTSKKMGTTYENFLAIFKVQNVKTSLIERIS